MPHLDRDGVRLYYEEAGSGSPPLVLIHGWTCDHTFLQPQFEHFRRSHRVISLDLRGHGRSDKPEQVYSMSAFADDVAWLCAQLKVERPVVVGHSMGGVIALVLAAGHPRLAAAIASLDSTILPTAQVEAMVRPLLEAMRGPDGAAVQRQFLGDMMFIAADDPVRKERIIEIMCGTPRHVMLSAFDNLFFGFDHAGAAAGCTVPWLALYAQDVHSDVARLRQLCPTLTVGQTVGAGHFLQLEVPQQVNPMIERFLRISAL